MLEVFNAWNYWLPPDLRWFLSMKVLHLSLSTGMGNAIRYKKLPGHGNYIHTYTCHCFFLQFQLRPTSSFQSQSMCQINVSFQCVAMSIQKMARAGFET